MASSPITLSVIDFAYNHIAEREMTVAWYTWHDGIGLSDRIPTTEQLEGLPVLR